MLGLGPNGLDFVVARLNFSETKMWGPTTSGHAGPPLFRSPRIYSEFGVRASLPGAAPGGVAADRIACPQSAPSSARGTDTS